MSLTGRFSKFSFTVLSTQQTSEKQNPRRTNICRAALRVDAARRFRRAEDKIFDTIAGLHIVCMSASADLIFLLSEENSHYVMGKRLSVEVCEKNVESAGAQPHLPL